MGQVEVFELLEHLQVGDFLQSVLAQIQMLQLAQMRYIFDKLNMIGSQIKYSEILGGFQARNFG